MSDDVNDDAEETLASSFRDPSGYVFRRGGVLYRQVNASYLPDYAHLMRSGLYRSLADDGLLIPHAEQEEAAGDGLVLRPEPVPFVSYPYEWCFGQLKNAALATLRIQQRALAFGMSLKDASAYNIQFVANKPLLLDTLSFERYRENEPWAAYRQFCQHFLAPLALTQYVDAGLAGALLRTHLDGIALDLASRLLPATTRLRPALLGHLHLHAAAQRRVSRAQGAASTPFPSAAPVGALPVRAFRGMLDSLEAGVQALAPKPAPTPWAAYYTQTNYSAAALEAKEKIVAALLDEITPAPRLVWDFGANDGRFSRLASERGVFTVAWDGDSAAVENNYQACQAQNDSHLLPLVQDLTNPSPDQGWALGERDSLLARGPAGAVLALALIHHLVIGNNVPLGRVSDFFARCGAWLVLEFVPKHDSQVQRLLATRPDIFADYSPAGFETAFGARWEIVRCVPIPETERTVYLLRRKDL